jgi:hypothetical protein
MMGLLELRRAALRNRLHADSNQTLAYVAKRIAELRRIGRERLQSALPTPSDVDAFAGDYCPEVRGRFTSDMDGLRKLDILLDAVDPDELSARLRQWLGQAEHTD